MTRRRGARRRRVGVTLAQFIAAAAAPATRSSTRGARSRPTPGSSPSPAPRACGAEPRRPRPRPRRDGRGDHRPHARRHRLLPQQPDRRRRHARRVRARSWRACPPTCSCCSTRRTRVRPPDEASVDGAPSSAATRTSWSSARSRRPTDSPGVRVGYAIGPEPILDAARATAIPLGVTAGGRPPPRSRRSSLTPRPTARRVDAHRRAARRRALRLVAQGWPIPEAQATSSGCPRASAREVAERLFDAGLVDAGLPARGHPHLRRRARVCRYPPPDSG